MLSPGMIVAFSQKKNQKTKPQKFTPSKNPPENLTVLTWMLLKKKNKKFLQKGEKHLLGLYSCTPCFISNLMCRCKMFPFAEDQSKVLQQSNLILSYVQDEQRTGLYPGICNQKCQRNMQKKKGKFGRILMHLPSFCH